MKRTTVILITILMIMTMVVGCQNTANRPLTPDQNQTNNQNNNGQSSISNNQAMADKFENLAEQVPGVQKAYVAVSDSNAMNNNDGIGTINTNPGTNTPTNMNTSNNNGRMMNNDGLNYNGNGDLYNGNNPNNPSATDINDTSTTNYMVVMVGIKLDDQKNTATMTNIEKMVENKIRNADTRVTRVLVTTDAGMIEQINNINTSMRNGTSMTTIQRSIDNLTRSLTNQ